MRVVCAVVQGERKSRIISGPTNFSHIGSHGARPGPPGPHWATCKVSGGHMGPDQELQVLIELPKVSGGHMGSDQEL